MSFERKPGGSTLLASAQPSPSAPTPGRRTLVQDSVQMKVKTGEAPRSEHVKAAAAEGVSGSAGQLPYLARIQKAFGRHDVSSVRAHTDGAAQDGASAMGAEAYASGSSVAFGAAPDLHTAAHEAAHIVQQRSGLALAGGVGAAGDEHERNADAVADRVVAGQSAEDLLDRYAGGGAAAPVVQQKIKTAGVYLLTWKSIKLKQKALVAAADKLREEFRLALVAKGGALEDERFETVWNKIVGEDSDFDIDDPTGREELLAELEKRYGASKASAVRYSKTQTGIDLLIGPVTKAHPELEKKPGGRNTMMVRNPMHKAGPRKPVTADDRAQQTQTHLSTVTHHNYSGEGEESQSSIQKDQLGLITSTNNESTNSLLEQDVQDREDIRNMAARVAVVHGVGDMNKTDAMASRVLRHALKLLSRLEQHVDPKVKITVPGKTATGQDGVHAEIRIYQHDEFDVSTHHMPSGTKIPCAGCYLYFVEEGHQIGVYMGPMWLTEAALSQQLKGTKIGTIDGQNGIDLAGVAEQIKVQYEAAIKLGGMMGESWVRGGGHTHATNADSESELDDEEYEAMKKEALLRSKTPPRSGREPVKGKAPKVAKEPGAKRGPRKPKEDKQQPSLFAFGIGSSPMGTSPHGHPSPYGYPPMGMSPHGHPPPMGMSSYGYSPMGGMPMSMPPMGMSSYGHSPMGGMPMSMPPMGMSSYGHSPMGGMPMSMPPMGLPQSQPPPTQPSSMFGAPSPMQPQQLGNPLPLPLLSSPPQPSTPSFGAPSPMQPQQLGNPSPLPLLSAPPQPSTPSFGAPSPVQSGPSSPQTGGPLPVDPIVQQLVSNLVGALNRPPAPLEPAIVLAGQLSFMDALGPSGLGNVADLHNASGAANNCLINSIAAAAGRVVSLVTLMSIRQACGGDHNRFLGRDDVPTILLQLGIQARVVLIETVDAVHNGTAPYNAVIIGGGGPDLYIVNAHDLHFGWCRPKAGHKVVVDANTATFVPEAQSQPSTRPSSPLPPMAFHFGSSSPRRSSSDVDEDSRRRSPPRSKTKLPSWTRGSSLRRAQSEIIEDDLAPQRNPAKRQLTDSPPSPLTRAVSDLNPRPDKMQRGTGMRGGHAQSPSMRGGMPPTKKRAEIDLTLLEEDVDEDMDVGGEPKRQDRKPHDGEDDGGSGFLDSSQ